MKFRSLSYFTAAMLLLSACGQKEDPVYTVGEADNAMRLTAGIVDGAAGIQTKALDSNHSKHLALASGIKLRLRVSGTWTGHSPEALVNTPAATVGAETGSGTLHNAVTMDPVLYWDDYGTADPANASTGRTAGLAIVAVAVNDAAVAVPDVPADWTSYAWSVDADQTGGWTKKDLIASYNLQAGNDGTYKFDDYKSSVANAGLLEFRHIMSKVTVKLKANKGFADQKFVSEPTVKLHGFYQSGNVNLTTGALSNQSGHESGTPAVPTDIATRCETASPAGKTNVDRSALVFPGRVLAGSDVIATVTADGNIYKITAAKLYAAMTAENSHSDKTMKSGYNYILNITVDKTEVKVSATVVDWVDVEAAEDVPKIEIGTSYGEDGGNFQRSFSFYLSKNKTYKGSSQDYYGSLVGSDYQADRTVDYSSSVYTPSSPIYWPDHNTKYFFRGVWPQTVTTATAGRPEVSVFNNGTRDCQGIAVANTAYVTATSPSDLMLGIPERASEETGKMTEPADGIGATEGVISLKFKYRMCQVELHLKSSGSDMSDNVDFGSNGGAELAEVKIQNGYKSAYILMSDGSVAYANGSATADYVLSPKSSDISAVSIPTAAQYTALASDWSSYPTLVRHDAIVPQALTNTSGDLKFVITTGPAGNKDTYAIAIKDIKLTSINGTACDASNNTITAWEAGKRYVYTLKITKTIIKIEASMTDWIPVVAGGDFWL